MHTKTKVNDQVIEAEAIKELNNGDKIEVGNVEFLFHDIRSLLDETLS